MWRVWVCADVETEEEARSLVADMEDAVGKHDGDLQSSDWENQDDD